MITKPVFSVFNISGKIGVIGVNTVALSIPWSASTGLVATFISSAASVTVNGVGQTSGVTANDFTVPVIYNLTAGDGGSNSYAVSVTITYPISDTGQTQCASGVSADMVMAACPNASIGPVQDGDFVDIPAARSFFGPTPHAVYTSDYTTKDNVTGLIWKSCSEGLSGISCATGSAGVFTLSPDTATPACGALNYANSSAGYAGRTNWRLPDLEELQTLTNFGVSSPSIDVTGFPATLVSSYWSSSTYMPTPTNAWTVSFTDGHNTNIVKTTGYYVRCVATGP